jgi:hypothetical protein
VKPLTKLSPFAAVAASLASLTCCLPFGFLAALGSAGAAVWLTSLRPWLLGLSALLLIIGFCQLYIGRSACTRRTRSGVVLFWTAVFTILFLLLFPIGFGPRQTPAGQPPLATLRPANFSAFQQAFNDTPHAIRLVVLLSPT